MEAVTEQQITKLKYFNKDAWIYLSIEIHYLSRLHHQSPTYCITTIKAKIPHKHSLPYEIL